MSRIEKYIPRLSPLYCEPHRAYHSLTHIQSLIRLIKNYRTLLSPDKMAKLVSENGVQPLTSYADAQTALVFVAWFHDCYYDPYMGSPDNEALSANIFGEMTLADFMETGSQEFFYTVYDSIVLTGRHLEDVVTSSRAVPSMVSLIFMDLDMYGFSDSRETDITNPLIRQEYYMTPEPEYLEGRLKFLTALLAKERIYYTLPDEKEVAARENIAWMITDCKAQLKILRNHA